VLNIKKGVMQFQDVFVKMYPRTAGEQSELPVKNITFVVTENCNLRCTYCYEHRKNCDTRMSKDIGRKAVDMLFEEDAKQDGTYISSSNAEAVILEFIGGEPLLEVELMDYIIEYFRYKALTINHRWALHHMISISTNGILYGLEDVQRFIEKNEGRISISISIDGNKELHDSCRLFPDGKGSYDIVEKAFIKQLRKNPNAGTKLTLSPQNIGYLFEACKHLFTLGITSIFANCVFEKGWEIEHARILYNQMLLLANYLLEDDKFQDLHCSLFDETIGQPMFESDNENWCGGTGKMLSISCDGMVYPCLRYIPFSLKEGIAPIIIGDIHNGIEATPDQKEVVQKLNQITRRSQSTDECFNCPVASGCAWCSAYNYEETGSPDKRVTYICIMHKARVLANHYYWNKLYEKQHVEDKFKLNLCEEYIKSITNI